jgi:1,4-dihydroxy-2-naphthoyl-CoA synthase
VRRNADRRATDEAKEGLAAFLEKRKPGWRKN